MRLNIRSALWQLHVGLGPSVLCHLLNVILCIFNTRNTCTVPVNIFLIKMQLASANRVSLNVSVFCNLHFTLIVLVVKCVAHTDY